MGSKVRSKTAKVMGANADPVDIRPEAPQVLAWAGRLCTVMSRRLCITVVFELEAVIQLQASSGAKEGRKNAPQL